MGHDNSTSGQLIFFCGGAFAAIMFLAWLLDLITGDQRRKNTILVMVVELLCAALYVWMFKTNNL